MPLQFLVDWDDDWDFNDSSEDVTEDVLRASWKLGMGRPFETMADESAATLTLHNPAHKYNPGDAIGTAGGSVLLQRRMKIRDVTSGGTTELWNGWLEHYEVDWKPEGDYSGQTEIRFIGTGPKAYLEESAVSLPTYYNTRADVVIRDVLAQAQLPSVAGSVWLLGVAGYSELGLTTVLSDASAYSSLGTADVTLSRYSQDETTSAWTIIQEVTDAEVGQFYFGRDGRAYFVGREDAFFKGTVMGTIAGTGTYKPVEMLYTYGVDVQNVIRVNGKQRQTDADDQILWRLNGGLGVAAGGTVEQLAKLRRQEGQYVSSTGVSYQNDEWSSGTATILLQPYGPDVRVILLGGATGGTLVNLELVGPATYTQNEIAVEVRNQASVNAYGRRYREYDMPALATYAEVRAYADWKLGLFSSPRKLIETIRLRASDDGTANAHMIRWGMLTTLALDFPEYNSAEPHDFYSIIGEAHDWTPGVHTVNYTLNPVSESEGGA